MPSLPPATTGGPAVGSAPLDRASQRRVPPAAAAAAAAQLPTLAPTVAAAGLCAQVNAPCNNPQGTQYAAGKRYFPLALSIENVTTCTAPSSDDWISRYMALTAQDPPTWVLNQEGNRCAHCDGVSAACLDVLASWFPLCTHLHHAL